MLSGLLGRTAPRRQKADLLGLIPTAPEALQALLSAAETAVEAPIRSEVFGLLRFAEHGRSLGLTHRAARAEKPSSFFPRLTANIRVLRRAHRYIGAQAATGYDISPAAEWLLDNFHLIEAQLHEVRSGLPRNYFRSLPVLLDEPLAGLPRIYGVAWAFVAHTDSAFDETLLQQFLSAYQETRTLNLAELWALPTTLRVVLIENLRRLVERVALNKAARELANGCADQAGTFGPQEAAALLAPLQARGMARAFLAQLARRLQDPASAAQPGLLIWLQAALPDPALVQTQERAEQAADNLSVSNALRSLRSMGDADWADIVGRTSALMRLMLQSPVFAAEHVATRDQSLHDIERWARRSARSEVEVAQTLLDCMQAAGAPDALTAVPSHWLRGAGQAAFMRALGLPAWRWRFATRPWRHAALNLRVGAYLGTLLLGTLALVTWAFPLALPLAPGLRWAAPGAGWFALLLAGLLALPASEAVVALVNRLISESLGPQHLPRLAWPTGIPPSQRVLVVIPALLTGPAATTALVHRLLLHHLANPEDHAQFALLTDWADADRASLPGDAALLEGARLQIRALNAAYPRLVNRDGPAHGNENAAPRFILLHRRREYSEGERVWMGWERKRGKLETLVAALAGDTDGTFLALGLESRINRATRHVLTLDSDTELPPGRLRELVAVAAHPMNQPRLDASGGHVVQGYGILQPRLVTPLPAPHALTHFHRLFAGECGIDPYSAASSEVYQDLFAEGSFVGKGLLNVQAVHAVLAGRLPEGRILSHDLLEGALARCATVTDIPLIEDAPFHADVAASRVHRWTRGDWQLLPVVLNWSGYRLGVVNRWKLFDNLRRSLVAPASLVLLLLSLMGYGVLPQTALWLIMAAFSAGPLMGAVAGFAPSRDDIAKAHFYARAAGELLRALAGGLWHLALLLQHALANADAIARALYRMLISQRHLLRWTTAAAAQAQAAVGLPAVLRRHWWGPVLAVLGAFALIGSGSPYPLLTLALGLLWASAPVLTWWVSRVRPAALQASDTAPLLDATAVHLHGIARDTWRYFERSVSAQDRFLPPDNLQTWPQEVLAHRTSPTNMGLYLLSTACARTFGWIGTQELLNRLHATLATMATLQRHRGHFLNWYDTQSGAPLLPLYVSTVDSGNLSGHLLAVAQACRELALAPLDPKAQRQALQRGAARLRGAIAGPPAAGVITPGIAPELAAETANAGALPTAPPSVAATATATAAEPRGAADLLADRFTHAALVDRASRGTWSRLLALPDPLAQAQRDPVGFDALLADCSAALALTVPDARASGDAPDALGAARHPSPAVGALHGESLHWAMADHLATLRSICLDRDAAGAGGTDELVRQLHAIACECEAMAWQADFQFLYHPKRRLLHIGYRVAEQALDASFYDLLASESRLTSLLAIAKGDVPVRHWAALGRPFFATGVRAGLRSWSGSMFEYLMPGLVLYEPPGSVLDSANRAALKVQIEAGESSGVPWGQSESAYAGYDQSLTYQYAPQGVAQLALRRTPPGEWVVAPYATAMAAALEPRLASENFVALQALGARARYGFIEALDFSPAQQTGQQTVEPTGLHAGQKAARQTARQTAQQTAQPTAQPKGEPPVQKVAAKTTSEHFTPVFTFMAHHQGMSIVALANTLLDGVAQRWGMANVQLEAVASLLHERTPREVPMDRKRLLGPPLQSLQKRAPGLQREVRPGAQAVEPTHILGNGQLSLSLRANGAGTSRWGSVNLGRSRDDALRDDLGSFFYLRWAGQAAPVSITQHPAPDPAAQYSSTFHADRVGFDAQWPGLHAQMTVWVSPEDDIEFRQIVLCNQGDEALELELLSAFEVSLAEPRADESHPAFMNLFVRAQWQAAQEALVFERKPRLATEAGLHLAHFLAVSDPQVQGLRLQTDRQQWRGRNRAPHQPLGAFQDLPTAATTDGTGTDPTDTLTTGLDPVSALAARLRLAPGAKAELIFATAVSAQASTLHAVIDKYRQASHVQRASLMSATLTGIRLRSAGISADTFAAIQSLTTALVMSLTRPGSAGASAGAHAAATATPTATTAASEAAPEAATAIAAAFDRRLLWRLGLSGERPLILFTLNSAQGLGLLRALAQALRIWAWGGLACDLVVVNSEPASYQMDLQRDIMALRDRHSAEVAAANPSKSAQAATALLALRADELSGGEWAALHSVARLRLQGDGRPLRQHVQDWLAQHERARSRRQAQPTRLLATLDEGLATAVTTATATATATAPAVPEGQFVAESGEFRFDVHGGLRPARPWTNVLANPAFGALLTEAGGGYSWARNSRMNQLTAWSNDPVADPPAEWFLLQDRQSQDAWSVSPSAWGAPRSTYRVAHGQGYSAFWHRHNGIEVLASWCVCSQTSVKQVRLQLINRSRQTRSLRLVGLVEWLMGAQRADRLHTQTAGFEATLPSGQRMNVLTCTQLDQAGGFGAGTAFLALAPNPGNARRANALPDWSCDRRECFDERGRLTLPDQFGQASGFGLDPCAALASAFELAPGAQTERVYLLGYADNPQAARELALTAAALPPDERLNQVRAQWDGLLGATQVQTPDPLFDALVNRWLLYQTVACRLWAKAGFYQAGGATGFRDQLQDAMALAWAAPQMLRAQILLCASRQFPQGDVQHWWHEPGGAGVRTHFSDDLLWLPLACVHYLRVTGDQALLDERVAFIESPPVPEGAEDLYNTPQVSTDEASVYEHAARSIDHSLRVGVHGLPLMGTGDWNDGMNRVGHEGRGESVWLAWFLCALVADFAPLAVQRGDTERAARWQQAAQGWRQALTDSAWDGQWFRRAFFDNGEALGSAANPEARIDLIAQAWAVLSGVAPPALQRLALEAVETQLVDHEAGLIRLLYPPLEKAQPSAGYIQAYPPGVRENGGQYAHGAVWALMAQVRFARAHPGNPDHAELGYRYFCRLSPAHRSQHPTWGPAYGLEPYAMAGDVYAHPPYVGRGGWSWYTGAAGWLHRAAIESLFGVQINAQANAQKPAQTLTLDPCLPAHWPRAEITFKRDGRSLHITLLRARRAEALALTAPGQAHAGAQLLARGEPLRWADLAAHSEWLLPLL